MTPSTTQPARIRRTFRDLTEKESLEPEQLSILAGMGASKDFGWKELLKSLRILLIAEAGAGKTHECKAQQEAMWAAGEPAFYLDLAGLAGNDLRSMLSPDQEARFDAWFVAQSDMATFFLDSIDELRLTPGSFEDALTHLGRAVSDQLHRMRVVITTRPVAFDHATIRKHLPLPEPVEPAPTREESAEIATGERPHPEPNDGGNNAKAWRTVTLMPLSTEQVGRLAAREGVTDPEALLAAIRQRAIEEFTRRPLDVVELCAHWREFHRIGTHREQIVHNIAVKLKPREQPHRRDRSSLSPDKARKGAARLALAALLTRKLTIRHSVEADKAGEPKTALKPACILHDWTPEERKELLERALFGFATYGRVRFHHRSVLEYLAADCLRDRIEAGMAMTAVKRLLFAATPQGVGIVKPTMRPAAAWLAGMNENIFGEVRDREPDLLLDHADPQCLTVPQRICALRAYVNKYGHGGWRGLHVPYVQAHRFAAPELADEVRSLWEPSGQNPEVRVLLLDLIAAAPMPSCADIAYETALNPAAEPSERVAAVGALIKTGDQRIAEIARSLAQKPDAWPAMLTRSMTRRLFPAHLAPDQLCRILKRTGEPGSNIDILGWALSRAVADEAIPADDLEALRAGLTSLVTDGLAWHHTWPTVRTPAPHLVPVLAAVCYRLLETGQTTAELIRSSVIALRCRPSYGPEDPPLRDLRHSLSASSAPLREAAFWADDALVDSLNPRAAGFPRWIEVAHQGPIHLRADQDRAWILRTLGDPSRSATEREMMLYAAILLARDGTAAPRSKIESLKARVADSPALLAHIDTCLRPASVDPTTADPQNELERAQATAQRQKEENHAAWVAFWREVAKDPETAFSPERVGVTVTNLWSAMRNSGPESRASGWSRRFIERHFGKPTADRLREAMLPIWRSDRPTLRMERDDSEKNVFNHWWQLGLAAIAAEAEDANWAHRLSAAEAELAARYVPMEFDGFPSWLESLIAAHPKAVERTLGPELAAELDEIGPPRPLPPLLATVSYAPASAIARLFLPRLRHWFAASAGKVRPGEDPDAAVSRCKRVLDVLLAHADPELHTSIRDTAASHLAPPGHDPFTPLWLTTLLRLDPAAGVAALERRLEKLDPVSDASAIHGLLGTIGTNDGEPGVDLKQPGFTAPLLLRLLRLAYRKVRPQDDLRHEGPYSPGPRDRAEQVRSKLLNLVLGAKGPEAWAAKLAMCDDPLFAHFRDRIRHLAEATAAEEMDTTVLTESEVAAIGRYGESPPKTRDELFQLMMDRIEDIEDLLRQDTSPRELWAAINEKKEKEKERKMRKAISHELHGKSNHAYTLDQEAVTADEKKTDIRLRARESDQQAVIELKIGEKWSGRELRDTLKCQLVEKYMAADTCRAGCLLVTVATDGTWKHPDTDETLNSEGLANMLAAEARKIAADGGGRLRLAARILDLRPTRVASSCSPAARPRERGTASPGQAANHSPPRRRGTDDAAPGRG